MEWDAGTKLGETFNPADSSAALFIGRDTELAHLERTLADGERLITLVGTGGIGKSRLARESVPLETPRADLSTARRLDDVIETVAVALRASLSHDINAESGLKRLGDVLASRGKSVLLLDNAEHVAADVVRALRAWSEAAPEAQFIVTSRHALHLEGERLVRVEPLELTDAVALFVDRGARNGSELSLRDPDVHALVASLERIPMALELAAARINVATPVELRERLAGDLGASRREHSSEGRHRAVRRVLEGAWTFLTPVEREVLSQCSVFRGTFDLDAATAIVRCRERSLIDVLASLRDAALIRVDTTWGELRLSLSEVIRNFANQQLDDNARAALTERHGLHYAASAEALSLQVEGPRGLEAVRWLRLERDNLLAAFDGSISWGEPQRAARLALALSAEAMVGGPMGQLKDLLDRALDLETRLSDELTCRLLISRGELLLRAREIARSEVNLERALQLASEGEWQRQTARALVALGQLEKARANVSRARTYYQAAVRAVDTDGGSDLRGLAHLGLAAIAHEQGHTELALDSARAALGEIVAAGSRRHEASCRLFLGRLLQSTRRLDEARDHFETALSLSGGTDWALRVTTLVALGDVLADSGEYKEGVALHREALELDRRLGNQARELEHLLDLATLEQARGQLDAATEWLESGSEPLAALGFDQLSGLFALQSARVAQELGKLVTASDELRRAHTIFEGTNEQLELLTSAHLAAVQAASGEVMDARMRLAGVRERADEKLWPVIDLMEAAIEVADADQSRFAGDEPAADGHVDRAKRLLEQHRESASPDVAIARRIVQRGLASLRSARAGVASTLRVGPGGAWFRLNDGDSVDLSRRQTLNKVLEVLADTHRQSPGEGLESPSLFQHAWGKRLGPQTEQARVRGAINTLKRLGLGEVLLQEDHAYLLSPELSVERFDDA